MKKPVTKLQAVGLLLLMAMWGCSGQPASSPPQETAVAQNGTQQAVSEPQPAPAQPSDGTGTLPVVKPAAVASGTAEASRPERAPRLVVPVKRIDFGKQPKEKTLTRSFVVRNGGNAPLNITAVEPS
jgi:hypothetical protein